MDIKLIIESGILEAYVAGACTPDEQAEVQRLAAQYPEIRAELNAIEQAVEQYTRAKAVAPPPGLKDRIMNAIPDNHPSDGFSDPTKSSKPWLWIGLSILLAAAAIFFGYAHQQSKAVNIQLQHNLDSLKIQLDQCQTRSNRYQEIAANLRDRDTRAVELSDNGKSYKAYVYVNTPRQTTILDLSGVPNIDGKYLQFWAIVDGQPQDMGMIELKSLAGWQSFEFVAKAQAFAISAEDNPKGSPSPTMVVMIGKLG